MKNIKWFSPAVLLVAVSGCATIVNDSHIPVSFALSDGSEGDCTFRNRRGVWQSAVPGTVMIRRSDDNLNFDCKTENGDSALGMVSSEMDAAKFGASVIFIDLGITDAITDKHRTYQGNVVIPVKKSRKTDSKSNEQSPVSVSDGSES